MKRRANITSLSLITYLLLAVIGLEALYRNAAHALPRNPGRQAAFSPYLATERHPQHATLPHLTQSQSFVRVSHDGKSLVDAKGRVYLNGEWAEPSSRALQPQVLMKTYR